MKNEEKKPSAFNKIINLPPGKTGFWTPKYMCNVNEGKFVHTPTQCKIKKGFAIGIFAFSVVTIVINLLWIIAGIYNTSTGDELFGYVIEATLLGLGLFIFLPIWIVLVLAIYFLRENNILKSMLIIAGIIFGGWLIFYLVF